MTDLATAESLALEYKRRAEKSREWTDYVRAHGLANFCVVKDPTEDRRKLVYDIEESWYKKYDDTHPLTYVEHQQLISQHKSRLKSYRDKTAKRFKQLEFKTENFVAGEISSEKNLTNASEFSEEVLKASRECSEGLVDVTKHIIGSSVDNLQKKKLLAPCKFAVIGLGSIAKGEATPYSDLEYAFIVENKETSYFERLAVDSYFRLSNLGETPLKYFSIEELKTSKEKQPSKENPYKKSDDIAAGLRIDGLMEKAGNIPTGNGRVDGKSLTRTVGEFIDLYKSEAEAPFDKNKPGDLSDMLASSVLIYTNEGKTSPLRAEFDGKRMWYELSNENRDKIFQKRFESFEADIKAYNFLPEFISFQPPNNMNIQIKTDIFRYPTLLANNIKMLLGLDSQYSWECFPRLHKHVMLSDENYRYIKIVLALSIYMRTSAYISYGSQTESMSLKPTIDSSALTKYNVSGVVFVLYGCLLSAVKKSVTLAVENDGTKAVHSSDVITSIFSKINISGDSFWESAQVCYFAGQYHLAISELTNAIGTSVESLSCDQFLQTLEVKSIDCGNVTKLVELCCYVLYYTGNFKAADSYLQWLLSNRKNRTDVALLMLLAAHCKKKMHDYQTSRQLVTEAKSRLLQDRTELSVIDRDHRDAYISYNSIGIVYSSLGEHWEALGYFAKCLCKCIAVYGDSTNHPDIADIYNNIGNSYNCMGRRNTLAIEYYTKSLEMRKAIYGATTNHPDIAGSYNNIGIAYTDLGENTLAIEYHTKSIDMYKAIYGATTNHPDIACSYNNIGNAYSGLGENTLALEYYIKSIDMKAIYGATTNHPDIPDSYNNIGDADSSRFKEEHRTESPEMYGRPSNDRYIGRGYTIGYSSLGENTLDVEYFNKAKKLQIAKQN